MCSLLSVKCLFDRLQQIFDFLIFRFWHPAYDPDRAQMLISSYMSRHLSTRKISSKSMHTFLSNLAHRQTDKYRRQVHLPPALSNRIATTILKAFVILSPPPIVNYRSNHWKTATYQDLQLQALQLPSDHMGSDKEQPTVEHLRTQAAVASWLVAVVLACAEVDALAAGASYLVHWYNHMAGHCNNDISNDIRNNISLYCETFVSITHLAKEVIRTTPAKYCTVLLICSWLWYFINPFTYLLTCELSSLNTWLMFISHPPNSTENTI